MPYVMISHKVANYAKWKKAVRAFAKVRKASGEKCFYACRNSQHPNDVMVWCEWDTAARMQKFLKSAELRKAMKEAGVVGKPQISTFNRMDVLTVS
jgi:heme-degrading monooxygenase HmoA